MLRNELSCDCNIIHKDVVARALKNKPEDYELIALSEVFKILGDLTRIKIIWTLDKEEMCVCDIANVLNMSKSSISHQLAILRKASIVKYRKSGKEVYYSLDDDHISKLYEIGIEHIEHKKRKEETNEKI
jgi:ArsR family transcriptional regulator